MKSNNKKWEKHLKKFKNEKIYLGKSWSDAYLNDSKTLLFCLSRYKFVSKLLSGKKSVLEVGCGEALGSPIVAQEVKKLHCVDFIEDEIKSNSERLRKFKNIKFKCLDMNKNYFKKKFDAAYLLDVFEHVNPKDSKKFIKNIYKSLIQKSILIIGVPNITAHKYASKNSKKNHINLMHQNDLKKLLSKYFEHNLIFGMNDEVLHTGFFPMAQYIFIVSINKKKL